jgi:hypothetical protein
VTNIKALIEAEVEAMLHDLRASAPSDKVALARAIASLASALPEFGATTGGGLRGMLDALTKTKETKDD